MAIPNQVQLITYPDSLGGHLCTLNHLLRTHFRDIFPGGVHILPPFPSSGDRGFAPLTSLEIDSRFGTWADIRQIGERFPLIIDLIVNHISRQSLYFQDFVRHGRQSPYADLFLTLDKIWPQGRPPQADVDKIFLRKPEHPFSDIPIEQTGQIERVWTTFGPRVDWSEQIDLDAHSPVAKDLLISFLRHFSQQQARMVRLDAAGYVIKKPGTSCFFVEPEIYDFMGWVKEAADSLGLALLPEVHVHYSIQWKLATLGYWVYDFVLPMLILYSLLGLTSQKLQQYLKRCPRTQITILDCHDGIPVQPDMNDILDIPESRQVVEMCLQRGANLNRIISEHKSLADFDAHQINCTYYSALDCDDDAYLAARAIQFFAPGVPQVYYVGLLAGENDQEAVQQTGEGRAVNRHNYSVPEVEHALQKPVVQRLLQLIRFRNTYPAFSGDFQVLNTAAHTLGLRWEKGAAMCRLHVDLATSRAEIAYRDDAGRNVVYAI